MLRLSVEAGGCSGFSYKFTVDGVQITPKDLCVAAADFGSLPMCQPRLTVCVLCSVFENKGASIVVDDISMGFVGGSTIDFVVEMVSESFQVVDNPNAEGSCGCGTSFTPGS